MKAAGEKSSICPPAARQPPRTKNLSQRRRTKLYVTVG